MCIQKKNSKKENWIMRLCVTAIVSSILFIGCNVVNYKLGLKQDNPLEEFVEEIIEAKTGIDVDLTPLTNEQHHYR